MFFFFNKFSKKNKKIGLAFGGGGVRGSAHIGILQVLIEENVPIHCVSGTSIGAVVGALFAEGTDIDELTALVNRLSFKDFMAIEFKFQGISSSEKTIGKLIKKYVKHDTFKGLKMPFSVVTTDVCSAKPLVIKDGCLSKAVAMSATFPTIFSPVEHNGSFFIDGGVFINVPTKQARDLGANIVIGINLNPVSDFSCVRKTGIDVANRAIDLLIESQHIEGADLVVRPIKNYIPLYDTKNKKELIELGRKCAKEDILPFLRKKNLI